jgi:pyruvate dehydrogenase E2 component (dihydrolipoamide acetyltransferase)
VLDTFFDEGALVPVFTNLFVVGEAGETVDSFRPNLQQPGHAATAATPPQEPGEAGVPPAEWTTGPAAAGPLTPRARRFAEEHKFHPPAITGSGPGGRVIEEDLRRLYYASSAATIREKIARRMRESLSTTAQYTLHSSAGAAGLLTLRARVKASTGQPDININDLLTFCAIQALLRIPEVNAEFIDGKIHQRSEIHLGFACDTPRGLLVPVIRDAHKLGIAELAIAAKELTAQAQQGTISADRLSGGTFTVSNLGGLGIEWFTPLLNPPQVAILGVGAIQLRPARSDRGVEFFDVIGLSLTCDHQVIDGAPGARFLKVLKEQIENVESLCTI